MSSSHRPVVHIVSNLRVRERYVRTYINQIQSLSTRNFEIGQIVLVCDEEPEGTPLADFAASDSRVKLVRERASDRGVKTLEEKVVQWAAICNQGIEQALAAPSDFILFIESDLCIPFDLLEPLVAVDQDIVAPLVFLGGVFYDTWGFRDLKGQKLKSVNSRGMFSGLVELSSVGSCVLFRTEIFDKGIRFRGPYETGLLVGVCNDARKMGYRVWAVPDVSITHPTTLWHEQIWVIRDINFHLGVVRGRIACDHIISSAYPETIRPFISDYLSSAPEIEDKPYQFQFRKDPGSRSISVDVYETEPPAGLDSHEVFRHASQGAAVCQ